MIGLAEKETKEQCTENPEVDDKVKADKESEKAAKSSKKHEKKAEKENAELEALKDYAKGVEMTVKLLSEAVKNLGMTEIGAEGEQFDPSVHEAVMHIEDEGLEEYTVCKVLQKGYKIGDTVIRPAMVQVAN